MTRSDLGQVVAWYVCTVVACVFLICRLAVRFRLLNRLYLDDLLVCLAALCLIADLAIQHYMFNQGMSEMASITLDEEINIMKMILPGSVLYVTSLWLIKSSMVIFYKRLADRTRYQLVFNITFGVLAATWLLLFFDIIFKCYPPQRQWTGLTNSEFNIFSDVFIICLPVSLIIRLKIPKKQKWAVISVFLLGTLVVITSVIRAIYSHRNEQMLTCTVSMIETAIAIIASCLPVLRTLVFYPQSRTGNYSGHRAYELSDFHVYIGAQTSSQQSPVSIFRNHIDLSVDEISFKDSEDGLVKDAAPAFRPGDAGTREYFTHKDTWSISVGQAL
ncbi:hypothetical protein N7494_000704 [Penicillium frequentans]|uniref:Rhodopsin domain-containing protein n=1 Tax=Penicillium frequentans TaxID=3151616 RepID=A0AAD6GJ82_9EURO|nr:hypothetical protein N7494_000704 [Penicillium glabrum]